MNETAPSKEPVIARMPALFLYSVYPKVKMNGETFQKSAQFYPQHQERAANDSYRFGWVVRHCFRTRRGVPLRWPHDALQNDIIHLPAISPPFAVLLLHPPHTRFRNHSPRY